MAPSLTRLAATVTTSALAVFAAALLTPTQASAATPDLGQHVAVPAYIPAAQSADWAEITTSNPQLGFIVANVNTGPDSAVNPDNKARIDAAHNAGTRVLGYVDTGYLGGYLAGGQPRRTVNGDTDLTSWLVQTEQDIDRWYQFYGTSMGGIFLDDGFYDSAVGCDARYTDTYTQLTDYIHTFHPGATVVLNPGVTVPDCYDNTADILVTFEGSATDYLNPTTANATAQWQLDSNPDHFWHIVFGVTAANQAAVLAASKSNNAGYIYLTDDSGANPYDTAPGSTVWSSELSGSTATGTAVPATPARPTADDVYSTGDVISWTSSSSPSVKGYDVYRGTSKIASVANFYPDRTTFTDVGLTPATTYSYTVKARHADGKVSAASTARSVTTDVVWGTAPSAPTGVTATNATANAVQLAWNAAAVTDDPVAYYDVYVNGVRKVTLDPATRSIHLGYLLPGTTYSLTIKARGTSNAESAASTAVTVTTPNPAPIDNATVTYTATTATFVARYNLTFTAQNVFIDTDGSATTGYTVGRVPSSPGATTYTAFGAEYLIQNSTLYQRDPSKAPADWGWIPVNGVSPLVTVSGGTSTWQVPTSTLGSPASLGVVFNGSGNSPDATLPVLTASR